MEKIIVVASSKLVTKGDNQWAELVDVEGKTHRVFKSIQSADGEWKHFEDWLPKLEKSEGKTFKLIKEKKGNFWNVVGIEEYNLKDIPPLVEEAVKQGAVVESVKEKSSGKNRAFALSYAKDIAVADIYKDKNVNAEKIIELAKRFDKYLETGE